MNWKLYHHVSLGTNHCKGSTSPNAAAWIFTKNRTKLVLSLHFVEAVESSSISQIFQLHFHHFPIFLNEKGLCPTKTFVHKIMLESLTLMLGCSWNLRPRAWQYRPYCFGSPDALWTPEATSRGRVQRFVVCISYGNLLSTALKPSSE